MSCRSRAKRRRSSATAISASSARASRSASFARISPPISSHRALVAETPAVMPQNSAASGFESAMVAAATAVIAAHALAPDLPSSRTVAADPAQANSHPNASSTASVSATAMASIARTGYSTWPAVITAIRNSAEKAARPAATATISPALGSDVANASTRGQSQRRPKIGPPQRTHLECSKFMSETLGAVWNADQCRAS